MEVTFLLVHPSDKPPLPEEGAKTKQVAKGFSSHLGAGRERMVPSVCIKIKNDPWKRENPETYTYNSELWEADMKQLKAHIHESTWLWYLHAA